MLVKNKEVIQHHGGLGYTRNVDDLDFSKAKFLGSSTQSKPVNTVEPFVPVFRHGVTTVNAQTLTQIRLERKNKKNENN